MKVNPRYQTLARDSNDQCHIDLQVLSIMDATIINSAPTKTTWLFTGRVPILNNVKVNPYHLTKMCLFTLAPRHDWYVSVCLNPLYINSCHNQITCTEWCLHVYYTMYVGMQVFCHPKCLVFLCSTLIIFTVGW